MKNINKLIEVYSKANPYVKFLSVASLVSASTTLSTDIGNIISTCLSEPPKIYESLKIEPLNITPNNMFQKTL